MWKRVAIAIVCVTVLLALCVSCAPAAAPVETPVETQPAAIQITPVSGLAKTTITLYGAGFVPGENVRVEVVMGGLILGLGMGGAREAWVANEAGAIVGQIRIPSAYVAEPGVYTVTATGDQGSVAVFPMGVLAPPEG